MALQWNLQCMSCSINESQWNLLEIQEKGLREVGVMYCISMYQLYVTFVSSVVCYICIFSGILHLYLCISGILHLYQRCITFVCISDTLHLFVSMIYNILIRDILHLYQFLTPSACSSLWLLLRLDDGLLSCPHSTTTRIMIITMIITLSLTWWWWW